MYIYLNMRKRHARILTLSVFASRYINFLNLFENTSDKELATRLISFRTNYLRQPEGDYIFDFSGW